MKRAFNTIIGLDLLLLLLPTRGLGPQLELWIAGTLAVMTAVLWARLNLSSRGADSERDV